MAGGREAKIDTQIGAHLFRCGGRGKRLRASPPHGRLMARRGRSHCPAHGGPQRWGEAFWGKAKSQNIMRMKSDPTILYLYIYGRLHPSPQLEGNINMNKKRMWVKTNKVRFEATNLIKNRLSRG